MSNDSDYLYRDLEICPWLKDGARHTPTLSDLAARMSQRPGRVLVTGCGSGELLRLLHNDHGFPADHLYGCDIEPDHAELARRRTGLKTIIEANFNLGNPFPEIGFDWITAMNWLQSDWPYEYPVKIERAKHPGINRYQEILDSVSMSANRGAFFAWDFHKMSLGQEFQEMIERRGWPLRDTLFFPCNERKRYPEFYPIFIYQVKD